jgi:hypothetical protein
MDLQAWLRDVRDYLRDLAPMNGIGIHEGSVVFFWRAVPYRVTPINHYRFEIQSDMGDTDLTKSFRLDGAELDAATILDYVGA